MYFIVRVKRNTPNRLAGLTLCVLVTLLASCSSTLPTAEPVPLTTQSVDLPEGMPRDPANTTYTAQMVDGRMVYSSEALPESSRQEAVYYDDEPAKEPWASQEPREIIDPELREATYGDDAFVEVYLRFEDPLVLPQFYVADTLEPADSFHNQSIRNKNEQLASAIREARAPFYQHVTDIIESQLEGKVLYESMLNNALTVELPRNSVKLLERLPSLQQASLVLNDILPSNVSAGRSMIQSDPYYAPYSSNSYAAIAVIDSGIRTTHMLLQGVIGNAYDCTGSTASCTPNDAAGDVWFINGHGTSSAGIIAGNNAINNNYRGLTQGLINSYRVFDGPSSGQTIWTQRAINQAPINGNKVLSMSIGSTDSALGSEADGAFNAGSIVVAAIGNTGPSNGTGQYPGLGHKVLGVGAIDFRLGQFNEQSRGPASDNRVKPDIQAPTGTIAAAANADGGTQQYTHTSGATPYAAGAAALMWRRLFNIYNVTEPGQTYAHMIAFGTHSYPFNTTNGAGLLKMPPLSAPFITGTYDIDTNQTITLPLPPTGSNNYRTIKAAIWWPEPTYVHNDIDLFLLNPSGTVVKSSLTANGVFEKVKHVGSPNVDSGVWQIQIRGTSVPVLNQKVYVAAYLIP